MYRAYLMKKIPNYVSFASVKLSVILRGQTFEKPHKATMTEHCKLRCIEQFD